MNWLFIFLILIVILIISKGVVEPFSPYNYPGGYPFGMHSKYDKISSYYFPILNGYFYDDTYFDPYLRHSKGMNYDIRGDPYVIPKTSMVWNNGTLMPIHNYLDI